ncbi:MULTISPECIES: iron donor protein CyaY [Idiomarinaceae]|uniref:Iron-sulfur cluster assembly protein CyaY n=4 Tax=Pseudidiomarina TaxID=2800384 RepID=A0A368UQ29_9GAMM|nr:MULTISPECIES: iron donor protein CyaY [Idiomarinaceae]MDT7525980.1 iron donor protein CyaY [Pseudidiomarina sp. GXY010]MDX1526762.1 iron donor protein CyaY [Pseudidiomarina maritima]MRJ41746.1 iron donor protein CyaY [Idiomarina sp. FeN1]NCU57736.1 iron donor protein CyaY [Idiomarina sp. FenA--70]NCU60288.1 iron donor protein CyaY [Idiomarina sp. FenBw--71]
MQEHDYHELAEATILAIEEAVEACHVDIDTESGGDILELTFPNNTKMVINKQPPLQQLWVATKFNGHHFEYRDGVWIDNRTGAELWQLLSEAASKQAETDVTLAPLS